MIVRRDLDLMRGRWSYAKRYERIKFKLDKEVHQFIKRIETGAIIVENSVQKTGSGKSLGVTVK